MDSKKITQRMIIVSIMLVFMAACTGGEGRQEKYMAQAQAHFDEGNYKKAQVDVRNVLQINENHAEARYLYALLHEREQNWQQMFANLNLAIELDPALLGAHVKLGQIYYANRLFDKTMEQADTVLALEENNPDGLTLKGSVYYRTGRFEEAIEYAQRALAKTPGHIGAISILTEIYKEKDPQRALAVIGDGIEKQTKNATLKLLKISVLEKQDDIDGVVDEYRKLIAEHPENLFFHYRLVKFYEKYDRVDEAEALLRDIVKTKPENVQLKLWLAQFIASQRNLALAEATVKDFIAREPGIFELRFALAKIYIALRQYPQAEQVFVDLINLDKEGADSLNARNELVKLHLAQNRQDLAEALLEEIFSIEPENEAALITQARLSLAKNEAQASIPMLRTALKNNPKSLDALLLIGSAHEAEGNIDLAMDNYRNALVVQPGNASAIISVARLQVQRAEYDAANQLLERFLEVTPKHVEGRRLLVESYSKQARWKDAISQADLLEKAAGGQAIALYLKARIHFAQREYKQAIVLLQQLLKSEPSAIEGLLYLVRSYVASGDEEAGYQYLAGHVAQYPQHTHALEMLGTMQRKRGDVDQAIKSYQSAIANSPNKVSTYVALMQTYTSQGNYQAALDVGKKALDKHPNNLSIRVLMAGIYEKTEAYARAIEQYEEVLAIKPDLEVAANNLAMILVDHFPTAENMERALALTQRFRNSDSPLYQNTLGWVYYRSNDYASAIPLLRKAAEAQNSPSIFHYHLGMAYYQLGNKAKAREALQLAMADDAQFEGAEEARSILKTL